MTHTAQTVTTDTLQGRAQVQGAWLDTVGAIPANGSHAGENVPAQWTKDSCVRSKGCMCRFDLESCLTE